MYFYKKSHIVITQTIALPSFITNLHNSKLPKQTVFLYHCFAKHSCDILFIYSVLFQILFWKNQQKQRRICQEEEERVTIVLSGFLDQQLSKMLHLLWNILKFITSSENIILAFLTTLLITSVYKVYIFSIVLTLFSICHLIGFYAT